jgi:hypothetical protein
MELPSFMDRHDSHLLHGVDVGPSTQFMALASARAVVVFPVPRGPQKRYACEMRPLSIAF